eukprot:CAMPEP_0171145040 /NCGR_PEP_ID=MMETSP0766_2-20121228/146860_1 /TAXON_ID=439317 /ORGANISM="Gambierdiscus australes, Strain CAWD 149" /LENGTH=221 /DNA_ID=CAMNT_0011608931 /DNA_START=40 /DNA_END=706 /DNA_ORIENTATION=-
MTHRLCHWFLRWAKEKRLFGGEFVGGLQRKPTEACHRKARRKKKKGSDGSTSTIGANMTHSSGRRACATSGDATTAPLATSADSSCCEIFFIPSGARLPAGATKAGCSRQRAQRHAQISSTLEERAAIGVASFVCCKGTVEHSLPEPVLALEESERVAERAAQRKPTEACHRKARRKKKKGSDGNTSTIGANMTHSSGKRACAASGTAATAPLATNAASSC